MLVYAIAIFLSAALLFLVQPLTGKLLLPLLGGSPSVWNTCMVFFQGALLAGYFYSHLISKVKSVVTQGVVHAAVLGAAWITLPIALRDSNPDSTSPTMWLLVTLVKTVGLPFFCVATTGPLVQRWFSRTDHPAAKDPYFLYAMSNAGSVVGLLAYPAILEPLMTRQMQGQVWAWGFGALCAALVATMVLTFRRLAPEAASIEAEGNSPTAPAVPLDGRRRLKWVLLAFVPSSLMIGVTQSISTDVAAVPLLWIVPLLLYLVSFILAFSKLPWLTSRMLGRVLPLLVIPLLAVMLTSAKSPLLPIVLAHLAVFGVAATMCHRAMAEDRPEVKHLTEFYLWMSVGGVLGGIANALVAPVVFDRVLEYPIVLALACMLRPQTMEDLEYGREKLGYRSLMWVFGAAALAAGVLILAERLIMVGGLDTLAKSLEISEDAASKVVRGGIPCVIAALVLLKRGSVRFVTAAAVLLIGSQYLMIGGPLLFQTRTFFGVHRVIRNADATWCVLHHGTTLHGLQIKSESLPPPPEGLPVLDAATRDRLYFGPRQEFTRNQRIVMSHLIPSTYYHPTGPIGDVMHLMIGEKRLTKAAFVGMGSGSLAAYGRPGMKIDFYEIDPAVVQIAMTPEFFSYTRSSLADEQRLMLGDGRVEIAKQPNATYDLIVIDAFSSDAIPVHLITKEALELYLSKLRPGGLLAFHISNRYFDLAPVLSRLVTLEGKYGYLRVDDVVTKEESAEGKKDSNWVVVCNDPKEFAPLSTLPLWRPLKDDPRYPTWTDDFSNILSVFVGW